MKSINYKLPEFYILFILLPISFTLNYPIWMKLSIGFLGFLYVVYVLLKIEKMPFKIAKNLDWNRFWKRTLLKFIVIASLTLCFVWVTDKSALFQVLQNKPKWLLILVVYSVFSVYPQELIYRTFYFQRYEGIFSNKYAGIFINAIVFSLAHIIFQNTLVHVMTFLGGLVFAFTYYKTKSTLLVSIEHAVYGCWLYTVGMGEMLGFPS